MLLLIIFGLGMSGIGCFVIIKPMVFAKGILTFSEKPWFHPFEITSRLLFGLLFLYFAEQSGNPKVYTFIGALLCFVSVFLVVIGAERHKQFARLTSKIGKHFRPLGLLAIVCGAGLIYLGVS